MSHQGHEDNQSEPHWKPPNPGLLQRPFPELWIVLGSTQIASINGPNSFFSVPNRFDCRLDVPSASRVAPEKLVSAQPAR